MQDACRRRAVSATRQRTNSIRLISALAALLCCNSVFASGELWVEDPEQIAYSVGDMTAGAEELGLSEDDLADVLTDSLKRVGMAARKSELRHDSYVLFLDVVVEGGAYYTSLGFWRTAEYALPDGSSNSDHVIVWQDYAIGEHGNKSEPIRATIDHIIDRFIAHYSVANDLSVDGKIAANH